MLLLVALGEVVAAEVAALAFSEEVDAPGVALSDEDRLHEATASAASESKP